MKHGWKEGEELTDLNTSTDVLLKCMMHVLIFVFPANAVTDKAACEKLAEMYKIALDKGKDLIFHNFVGLCPQVILTKCDHLENQYTVDNKLKIDPSTLYNRY